MSARHRYLVTWILITGFLVVSDFSFAGQWKPLCAEGGICRLGIFYPILDPNSMSPPFTSDGFLLNFRSINYSEPGQRELLLSTAKSTERFGTIENWAGSYASDQNTIELPSGTKLNFSLHRVAIWQDPEDDILYGNWSGWDALNLNLKGFVGPPVFVDNAVMVGIRGNGAQHIFVSENEGQSWFRHDSGFVVGEDRFNLLPSPESTALWAIQTEFGGRGGLWESSDQGKSWVGVDDGSFPVNAVRVVHDPASQQRSFALTDHGLYVSENRGVTWQETSFREPIHSLIFLDRDELPVRVIFIGTDSGIKESIDDMASWTDMSRGLLAQPHAVTYGNGQLIATSDSGYFSCDSLDCFGAAQALPTDQEPGLVPVVEFYHPDLDHYFITATEEEATAIDQGAAGPGWVRTGENFLAWSLGTGDSSATDVCRFYGSMNPGPNSHFYSVSQPECRFLMDLQELIPDHRPRWNFEGYAFSILPAAPDAQQPCPETAIPVYRAYNDAYRKGEDSNHRYMTDLNLVDEMVAKGWIDEGIVFCSPVE